MCVFLFSPRCLLWGRYKDVCGGRLGVGMVANIRHPEVTTVK